MPAVGLRLQSIKARLVLFALLCAVPVITFAVLQLHADHEQIRSAAVEGVRLALDRLQARITQQLAAAEMAGHAAGTLEQSVRGAGPDCSAVLKRSLESSRFVHNFAIADLKGTIVCSADPAALGTSVSGRAYVQEALATRRATLSGFVRSASTGLPSVALAVPILDRNGAPAALSLVAFDAPALTSGVAPADRLVVALVDRSGVLTSRSLPSARIEPGALANADGQLGRLTASNEPLQLSWLDDRERLYLAQPIRFRDQIAFTAIVGVDVHALEAEAFRKLAAQAALVMLVGAGVVLLAMLATRPLVLGRLSGLLKAADEVAAGRYGSRVTVRVNDDLVRVERAFNHMLDAVQADRLRLERSERHYRLLFESSIDGVLATRPTGQVLAANSAACRILKRTEAELVAMHRSDIIDDTRLPQFVAERERQGRVRGELFFRCGDGSRMELEMSSVICVDSDGLPVTWTVLRDITERKRAQREIEELNRELERRVAERTRELAIANEELEAFSTTVSHDLRAPVAVVRSFSQVLLERQLLTGRDQDQLQRIKRAGDHMDELIAALLDLARYGRQPLHVRAVDISGLAAQVALECRDATGRELEVEITPGAIVLGDRGLVRVVLSNLLANAWKFTRDADRPRVTLTFEPGEAGELVITVRDNGAGFDPDHAQRLFQPFQRLHSMREFPGLGIGLALVHRIVQRHGGRIWASGQVGQGAAFHFTLKAAQDMTTRHGPPHRGRPPAGVDA